MSSPWSEIIGHENIYGWLHHAIRQGRLGGSLLLVGSPGVGKQTVATLLARTLLCEQVDVKLMAPCGSCEACVQVTAGTHPDLIQVAKPADKTMIPLELLIGRPEARMQEGFCRDVRLRPFRGRRKVAILHDADFLNEEGANCLLKTLEEPPSNAVILLIGTSEQKQLPTIRSRCQILRFASPKGADAARLLRTHHGIESDDDQIAQAIEISAGDMHVAARLLTGESDGLRESISGLLASAAPDPVAIARVINGHVDAAGKSGKDAAKRRAAMRDVFSLAVQHYRRTLRRSATEGTVSDATLNRLDRSIRALREVDRSANAATLIECYAADIAAGRTGDRGQIG